MELSVLNIFFSKNRYVNVNLFEIVLVNKNELQNIKFKKLKVLLLLMNELYV